MMVGGGVGGGGGGVLKWPLLFFFFFFFFFFWLCFNIEIGVYLLLKLAIFVYKMLGFIEEIA
jgi:hypothetical protein